MNHLLAAWGQRIASAGGSPLQRLYRGMQVIVPEGEPVTPQTVLAAAQRDTRWGLGPHWSTERSVSESFARPGPPKPVPAVLQGPGGKPWVDPGYRGPRGTGVAAVFEAMVPEGSHDAQTANMGVLLEHEAEVTLKPGTPIDLVAVHYHDGSGWVSTPMRQQVTARYQDVAYRGIAVHIKDREAGLEFLEAAAKRSLGLVAMLLMEHMAQTTKDRWWAAGDQPQDEAGRWWTTDLSAAWQYSRPMHADEDDFLIVPVLLTATSDEGSWQGDMDDQGQTWYHLDPGHPVKITSVEADLPTAQTLAAWYAEVESQGEYAVHNAVANYTLHGTSTDFIKLPIASIHATASATRKDVRELRPGDQVLVSPHGNPANDEATGTWRTVHSGPFSMPHPHGDVDQEGEPMHLWFVFFTDGGASIHAYAPQTWQVL